MAIIMRGNAQFLGTPNRSACWLIPWAYGEMSHIVVKTMMSNIRTEHGFFRVEHG